MAKKKNVRRLLETSPDDLREIARRLRVASTAIQALAKALENGKETTVGIEGHAMLERGFTEIRKFIANCQRKIREF